MIYLASTSPRRKKILKELWIVFKAIVPDYTEENFPKVSPALLVRRHALAKAVSCIPKVKAGTLLGVDTLVYCGKKVIGKPRNHPEAFAAAGISSRIAARVSRGRAGPGGAGTDHCADPAEPPGDHHRAGVGVCLFGDDVARGPLR